MEELVRKAKKYDKRCQETSSQCFLGLENVELRDYQEEGINWILNRFDNKMSVILGDEMGLGKTVQSIAVITHLWKVKNVKPPFLVVVPLSLVGNWADEFAKFSPNLVIEKYIGNKEEREETRKTIVDYIRAQPKSERRDPDLPFHVMITTYELILNDISFLGKFKWRFVVVDEAHRLKNPESKLFRAMLEDIEMPTKLLLTGTPIQNNLSELWALLHFLMPSLFKDREVFLKYFKKINYKGRQSKKSLQKEEKRSPEDEERASVLHEIMRPFILRRVKEDVLQDLPQKTEMVLYTGMSKLQKDYYKSILTQDTKILSDNRNSLMNAVINLKKCCNHPYLFNGAEPLFNGIYKEGEHLVENSGKLVVLDKLLEKFKKDGQKVLIFCQMTRMLDILQDYLHFRNYTYERLDGSVRGEERYVTVRNFNTEETFIFLLSTRAGGLGLNLTSASKVIFYDSDWNPQQDLQAQARVHRIGQKSEVSVIRLVARHTVEEVILSRAYRKLKLKHDVLDKGNFSTLPDDDMDISKDPEFSMSDVVKFGLGHLFENEGSTITDDDIEAILINAKIISDAKRQNQVEEAEDETSEHKESSDSKNSLNATFMEITDDDIPNSEKDNIYFFDGMDYSDLASKKKDSDVFDQILTSERNKDIVLFSEEEKRPGGTPSKRKHLTDEELEERKEKLDAKRQAAREKKWQTNGYKSLSVKLNNAVSEDDFGEKKKDNEDKKKDDDSSEEETKIPKRLAIIDDEESDGEDFTSKPPLFSLGSFDPQTSMKHSMDSSTSDADNNLVYVTGDASRPQNLGDDDNAIIVVCCDNSGKWSSRGFFRSISGLSHKPEEAFSRAHLMKDLTLGDVHLVELGDELNCSDQKGNLYVALVICQNRRGDVIGDLNLLHLQTGLTKVAQEARRLHASVHLPRIGADMPKINYYSVERMVRNTFTHTKAFIYYYRRGSRVSSSVPSSSPVLSPSPSFSFSSPSKSTPVSPCGKKRHLEEAFGEGHSLQSAEKKPKVSTTPKSPGRKTTPLATKKDIVGNKLHLYHVNYPFQEIASLIKKEGAEFHPVIQDTTDFIVVGSQVSREDKQLNLLLQKFPSLQVLEEDKLF
eukprot:TRINITY_DN4889_c0_g2_i1.p1 TRINITY_DN4889_c0_g2~~TRINITY_DN4889_c0_g2_i1.p1  ORF type:complete len:1099 (-),score=234.97 TRINITY_DN4889_c0_g2_i1:59-3355(-)